VRCHHFRSRPARLCVLYRAASLRMPLEVVSGSPGSSFATYRPVPPFGVVAESAVQSRGLEARWSVTVPTGYPGCPISPVQRASPPTRAPHAHPAPPRWREVRLGDDPGHGPCIRNGLGRPPFGLLIAMTSPTKCWHGRSWFLRRPASAIPSDCARTCCMKPARRRRKCDGRANRAGGDGENLWERASPVRRACVSILRSSRQ
jgi:hypothetical protein